MAKQVVDRNNAKYLSDDTFCRCLDAREFGIIIFRFGYFIQINLSFIIARIEMGTPVTGKLDG